MTQDQFIEQLVRCGRLVDGLGQFNMPLMLFGQLVTMIAWRRKHGVDQCGPECVEDYYDAYLKLVMAAELRCDEGECHREIIDRFVRELVEWACEELGVRPAQVG